MTGNEPKQPSILLSLGILIFVALLIGTVVFVLKCDIHVALILASLFAGMIGCCFLNIPYASIQKSVIEGIMLGMEACLIVYSIGSLMGIWIASGVIPSLFHYGLSIISPSFFLVATLLICSLSALAIGSSWGTSGTIGIALLGMSSGLGIPLPLTAGIIISGAYFGDKMSPLSDTTNLAPAVAGSDLFQHIKAMCRTSGATYIIVLIITFVLGQYYTKGSVDYSKIEALQTLLGAEFRIGPAALIAPAAVLVLSIMHKPPLPALWVGILAASVIGLMQGISAAEIFNILQNGYVPAFTADIAGAGNDMSAVAKILADKGITLAPDAALYASRDIVALMKRGGLQSMNYSVSLFLCAFIFGYTMNACGYLGVILKVITKLVHSVFGLVTAVITSCLICNILFGDQYLSLVMPGTMFKPEFDKKGLHPRMLSRSLEDCGTLVSVLVPWNSCGVYHTVIFGITTFENLPFAFFNYLNPIVAMLLTFFGIGISWRGRNGEPVTAKERPEYLCGPES